MFGRVLNTSDYILLFFIIYYFYCRLLILFYLQIICEKLNFSRIFLSLCKTYADAYSEPSVVSKMGSSFSEIVNGLKLLSISAKSSILDALLGAEYVSAIPNN